MKREAFEIDERIINGKEGSSGNLSLSVSGSRMDKEYSPPIGAV